jgi:predicted phage-related endonuclease
MSLDLTFYTDYKKYEDLSASVGCAYDNMHGIEDEIKKLEDEKDEILINNFNITNNLTGMAKEAGIYEALWRPDENGYTKANHILPILEEGLKKLKKNPEYYKKFNPPNGWGDYEGFVNFVENVLDECKRNPDADISSDS